MAYRVDGDDDVGLVDPLIVRVLGSPEVAGSETVAVRGARQTGALALLSVHVGTRVSTARLEDELWGGRAMSDAALRVTINRLRAHFASAGHLHAIVSEPTGYRLDVPPDSVDLCRFDRLVEGARRALDEGRVDDVGALVATALDLWRGPPFDDLPDLPTAASAAERAARQRVDAIALGAAAHLGARDPHLALTLLDEAGPDARIREDVVALAMIAAASTGRRDLALEHHHRLVAALDGEIGVAPGRPVAELRAAIEAEDADWLAAASAPFLPRPPAAAGPHLAATLSDADRPFVGRKEVMAEIERSLHPSSVVLVEGIVGMGKSSVAEEIRRRVAGRGTACFRFGCGRLEGGSEPMLRTLLDAAPDPEALRIELGGTTVLVDADLYRFRVHEAALACLRSAGPALVVVDDLHWIETSGARLLAHLVRGAAKVSWLLLSRPGEREAADQLLEDLRSARVPIRELRLDPLARAEVAELVRTRSAGAAADDVERVVNESGGLPMLATVLCRHAPGGSLGDPTALPSLHRSVAEVLARGNGSVRSLIELVAVAAGGVPLTALESLESGDALEDAAATALVTVRDGRVEITHELVAEAVRCTVSAGRLAQLHLEAARALTDAGPGSEVLVARHLLAAGPAGRDPLESVAGPAVRRLTTGAAHEEAAELALEVVAECGTAARSIEGIRGRMDLAAVLLHACRIDEGLALHEAVLPLARRLDDPVLLAAGVLARGSVDLGAADGDARVSEALDLLRRLPSDAIAERVQLSCWAAHHRINSGHGGDVGDLLDDAEVTAAHSADPELRALVLGLRYQAATMCSRPTADAVEARAAVSRWERLTGSISAGAMAVLFGLDQAAIHGTLDDHGAATARLDAMVERFPRPDMRWYVRAARAANLIAASDLDGAADAVAEAAELGTRLRVAMSESIAQLHQAMVLDGRGLLAVAAPLLSAAVEPGARPVDVALAGYVALAAGDDDRVAQAAAHLAARPALLADAGASWSVAAHMAAEVAVAARSPELGRLLVEQLDHRRGTGLSLYGLALFGSVDRLVGLGHAAMGAVDRARRLLEAAAGQDEARGLRPWAELARHHLERL